MSDQTVPGGQPVSTAPAHARVPLWLVWAYEGLLTLLAFAVLYTLSLPQRPEVRTFNLAVWAVFALDYGVRLALARDKRHFVRTNIPELIAILPLDFLRSARALRLVRLVRIVRAGVILWRVSATLRGILSTNGLGYLLIVSASVVVAGGVGLWVVEPGVITLANGLWWAVVTATTVGYGDIAPVTWPGRIVATILMVAGIGTISMITGTIATYFIGPRRAQNPHVQHVKTQLERWEQMDPAERRQLGALLMALVEQAERDAHAPEPTPPPDAE